MVVNQTNRKIQMITVYSVDFGRETMKVQSIDLQISCFNWRRKRSIQLYERTQIYTKNVNAVTLRPIEVFAMNSRGRIPLELEITWRILTDFDLQNWLYVSYMRQMADFDGFHNIVSKSDVFNGVFLPTRIFLAHSLTSRRIDYLSGILSYIPWPFTTQWIRNKSPKKASTEKFFFCLCKKLLLAKNLAPHCPLFLSKKASRVLLRWRLSLTWPDFFQGTFSPGHLTFRNSNLPSRRWLLLLQSSSTQTSCPASRAPFLWPVGSSFSPHRSMKTSDANRPMASR